MTKTTKHPVAARVVKQPKTDSPRGAKRRAGGALGGKTPTDGLRPGTEHTLGSAKELKLPTDVVPTEHDITSGGAMAIATSIPAPSPARKPRRSATSPSQTSRVNPSPAAEPIRVPPTTISVPVLPEADADLYQLLRLRVQQRKVLLKMRTAATNAVGAYARSLLGWSPNLSEKERADIAKRAAKMLSGQVRTDDQNSSAASITPLIEVLHQSTEPIDGQLRTLEKEISTIVRRLPEWTFFDKVRGCAELSAASVLAIVGRPIQWQNPAKLWKRLGLAPRVVGDTTGETTYRPHARAVMWVIGDCMIRAGSEYRSVYDARKVHTATTHPDWTKMHAHKDAHRVMVKALIRDFWVWGKANANTAKEAA